MNRDPRALARVEVSRIHEAAAKCRHPEDRLSYEVGMLTGALLVQADEFAEHLGETVIAQSGCTLAWLTFEDAPILVEYADEEMGTEVQQVWVNGVFVDVATFSKRQLEKWADELAAQIERELAEVEAMV